MGYKNRTETDRLTTSATSHTVNYSAHEEGDFLIAVVSTTSANTPAIAINTPSGWTKGPDVEAGDASAVRQTIFYRRGDGVSTSVAITSGTAVALHAWVIIYEGGEDLLDSGTSQSEASNTPNAPGLSATGRQSTIVLWAFCCDDMGSSTSTLYDDNVAWPASPDVEGYAEGQLSGTNGLACAFAVDTESDGAASIPGGTMTMSKLDANVAITCVFNEGNEDLFNGEPWYKWNGVSQAQLVNKS